MNGAFDTGTISATDQASFTAPKPGRYVFTSKLHPSVRGTLIVNR